MRAGANNSHLSFERKSHVALRQLIWEMDWFLAGIQSIPAAMKRLWNKFEIKMLKFTEGIQISNLGTGTVEILEGTEGLFTGN